MAVKILKWAPKPSWLLEWWRDPARDHWVVGFKGVPFAEIFRTKKGRKFYGLIYDRDVTEFWSGCVESEKFTEVVDHIVGVGLNRMS